MRWRTDGTRVAGDVPFVRHEWLEAWWRHYGQPGDELFIVALRSAAGELLGIAPWYRSGQLGLRTIRQLGSGEVASDYVGILSSAEHGEQVASELARWLAEEAAGDWDRIEIDAVRGDDPVTTALAAGLRGHGHTVDEQMMCQTWRVSLAGSWDKHLAGISKSRREQLRRFMRRSLDAGRTVVCTADSEAQLERGLRILADLHQRRRESLGEKGCFASPRVRAISRGSRAATFSRWADCDCGGWNTKVARPRSNTA